MISSVCYRDWQFPARARAVDGNSSWPRRGTIRLTMKTRTASPFWFSAVVRTLIFCTRQLIGQSRLGTGEISFIYRRVGDSPADYVPCLSTCPSRSWLPVGRGLRWTHLHHSFQDGLLLRRQALARVIPTSRSNSGVERAEKVAVADAPAPFAQRGERPLDAVAQPIRHRAMPNLVRAGARPATGSLLMP